MIEFPIWGFFVSEHFVMFFFYIHQTKKGKTDWELQKSSCVCRSTVLITIVWWVLPYCQQILVWCPTGQDDASAWPWTPVTSDKERANILLYGVNGWDLLLFRFGGTRLVSPAWLTWFPRSIGLSERPGCLPPLTHTPCLFREVHCKNYGVRKYTGGVIWFFCDVHIGRVFRYKQHWCTC